MNPLRLMVPPLLLAIIAMAVCWVLVGPTLGVAFAGFGIATLLSPAYASAPDSLPARELRSHFVTQSALAAPVLVVWIMATIQNAWSWGAFVWLMILLLTYVAAITLVTLALARISSSAIAGAFMTVVSVAWLTWPIWTAPWMTEGLSSWLIGPHPLFAANRVTGLNPWPQHEVIYSLTRLGQDVPYVLPASAWGAIGLHMLLIALGAISYHAIKRHPARQV